MEGWMREYGRRNGLANLATLETRTKRWVRYATLKWASIVHLTLLQESRPAHQFLWKVANYKRETEFF